MCVEGDENEKNEREMYLGNVVRIKLSIHLTLHVESNKALDERKGNHI